MKCPGCGMIVLDNCSTCPYCGTSLSDVGEAPQRFTGQFAFGSQNGLTFEGLKTEYDPQQSEQTTGEADDYDAR